MTMLLAHNRGISVTVGLEGVFSEVRARVTIVRDAPASLLSVHFRP